MCKKFIRAQIKKQLENSAPSFNRLKRKEKRRVVREAYQAVKDALRNNLPLEEVSEADKLGIDDDYDGIIPLEEMTRLIEDRNRITLRFDVPDRRNRLEDKVLRYMDDLFDDGIVNELLATPEMSSGKRTWMPARLLRIELLRTYRFGEWSVRKFCEHVSSLQRKEERAFCHLSLRKKEMPDHSQLSRFRKSLGLTQRINLMIYVLSHFFKDVSLGDEVIHMIDSTDVATPVNNRPLFKATLPDGDVRVYGDLDCDCGARRSKRDKSKMLVGYRVHNLCIVDVQSGLAFPLISILAAANHHDSRLLEPLLKLARAMGLTVKVLVADEAYADAEDQAKIKQDSEINVVTPRKKEAGIPENVDKTNGAVFCHEFCETPMNCAGYEEEDGGHLFTCADDGTCPFSGSCDRQRCIPLDTGFFGPIPQCVPGVKMIHEQRKIGERPFNLLKHMDGVEPCRMKGRPGLQAQVTFSQIVGLVKVMAGVRSRTKKKRTPRPVQKNLLADVS